MGWIANLTVTNIRRRIRSAVMVASFLAMIGPFAMGRVAGQAQTSPSTTDKAATDDAKKLACEEQDHSA